MIITAKTIVTGDGKTVLRDHAVRVGGNKILAVGPADAIKKANPAEECRDYGDATILPGLIDMHVHLASYMGRPDAGDFDSYLVACLGLNEAQRALFKGVTTLREVGSPHNVSKQINQAKKKGFARAPRILYSNSAICATGGHGWSGEICVEADGELEIRKAIRAQIRDGAHWIKIMTSHRSDVSEYTQAELDAAADEAHRHNRKVSVHTSRQPSLQMAINAGLDTIEHGCDLTLEQAREMRDKGIAWVPTLYVHRKTLDELEEKKAASGLESFTEREMETYLIYGPANARFEKYFKAFAEAGVMVVTGTDMTSFGDPVAPVAQEIALMVRYGMDPVWSIGAGTLSCAKVLGLDGELGEIAEGKLADILVVSGDATADIAALEAVVEVIQGGSPVRREI